MENATFSNKLFIRIHFSEALKKRTIVMCLGEIYNSALKTCDSTLELFTSIFIIMIIPPFSVLLHCGK